MIDQLLVLLFLIGLCLGGLLVDQNQQNFDDLTVVGLFAMEVNNQIIQVAGHQRHYLPLLVVAQTVEVPLEQIYYQIVHLLVLLVQHQHIQVAEVKAVGHAHQHDQASIEREPKALGEVHVLLQIEADLFIRKCAWPISGCAIAQAIWIHRQAALQSIWQVLQLRAAGRIQKLLIPFTNIDYRGQLLRLVQRE